MVCMVRGEHLEHARREVSERQQNEVYGDAPLGRLSLQTPYEIYGYDEINRPTVYVRPPDPKGTLTRYSYYVCPVAC